MGCASQLMQIVSYVSTFVSIALAFVAIYISVREATKGDQVKDQIYVALGEMKSKLNSIDIKVEKIDATYFNEGKDDAVNEMKESIMNDMADMIDKLANKEDTINLKKIINEKIDGNIDALKSNLSDTLEASITVAQGPNSSARIYTFEEHDIQQFIMNMSKGNRFTLNGLIDELRISVPDDVYLKCIKKMRNLLYIKTVGPNIYQRM
ncbi:hypothetical protein MHI32_11945 [Paenibacillus sp. FSL H7-0690]|uniref:hypothetical protein n=1 Tax=Paenibacillus sp. FSL H7-0690 TaxID=2921437 RepID=UPI0030ED06DC